MGVFLCVFQLLGLVFAILLYLLIRNKKFKEDQEDETITVVSEEEAEQSVPLKQQPTWKQGVPKNNTWLDLLSVSNISFFF